MNMTPGIRKLALTAHVTSSVGWVGAVLAFLALSIAGLTSRNVETVRSAYLAMNVIGEFIIVPLSLTALLTGIIQSLGTPWGLFRHYWVLIKLVLTIGATLLLLLHQFTAVSGAARRVSASAPGLLPDIGRWGTQLVGDASAAALVLLGITILAIYKPWGLTPYGRRRQRAEKAPGVGSTVPNPDDKNPSAPLPLGLKIFLLISAIMVAAFIALHLAGGGLHHGN